LSWPGFLSPPSPEQTPGHSDHWQFLTEAVRLSLFGGILAGFLPALKAARLDVLDALRFERPGGRQDEQNRPRPLA